MAEAQISSRMEDAGTFELDMGNDQHNHAVDSESDSDDDDIQMPESIEMTRRVQSMFIPNPSLNAKSPTNSSAHSPIYSKEHSPENGPLHYSPQHQQTSPTKSNSSNSPSKSQVNSIPNDVRSSSSRSVSPEKTVPNQTLPHVEDNKSPVTDSEGERFLNGIAIQEIDRFGFVVGGKEFTDPDEERRVPVEVLRKREMKWLDMFHNWEKWMSKRFKKVKKRCRKGIPPSIRSMAWQHLCGSKYMLEQNKGRFEEYLEHPGDPKFVEDIKKDLHRQFPRHEMFMSKEGYGQEDLYRILFAYTVHNPTDGYCQAQAPLAAVLLMHMPAEEAFWCFVSICDKYLPGYYSHGLEAIQVDGDILFGLMKHSNSAIYQHFKKHRVEPILYMTEWFMCVFSRTLPWSCVLRVWDMFFCEGVKVLFRIGLVLIRMCLGSPEKLSGCPGMYETLEKLRQIPKNIDEEYIVGEILRLNISERDMEKEHQKQVKRRAKEKNSKESGKSKSRKK